MQQKIIEKELDKCCGLAPEVVSNKIGNSINVQVFCSNKECPSFIISNSRRGYIEAEQRAFKEWNEDKRRYCKD